MFKPLTFFVMIFSIMFSFYFSIIEAYVIEERIGTVRRIRVPEEEDVIYYNEEDPFYYGGRRTRVYRNVPGYHDASARRIYDPRLNAYVDVWRHSPRRYVRVYEPQPDVIIEREVGVDILGIEVDGPGIHIQIDDEENFEIDLSF